MKKERPRRDVPRLLVVDDEPELAKLVVNMLTAWWPEAEIRTAKDGCRAIAVMFEHAPDLLITDNRMPGRTGTDLCRLVRHHKELAHTKVLMMTAYHSAAMARYAIECGADEYLAKPFSAEELRRVVSRLMAAARKPQESPV